jgi:hypothetical protein
MAITAVIRKTHELSTEWAGRTVRVKCILPAQVLRANGLGPRMNLAMNAGGGLLAPIMETYGWGSLINELAVRLRALWGGILERNRANADLEHVLWHLDPDVLAGPSAATLPRIICGTRGPDRRLPFFLSRPRHIVPN